MITDLKKHHKKVIVVSHKALMSYLSYNFVSRLSEVGIILTAGVSIGIAVVLVELIAELYIDEQVDHLFASWEHDKEENDNAEHSAKDSQ